MIPGFTETGTRLPREKPLFASQDDPALQKVIGVVFVVFLLGATWQVLRLRSARSKPATAAEFTASPERS